jgi:ABC-2 type transport system permease protein
MRELFIVFRREFLVRIRRPSFAISTLVTIAAMIAVALLPQVRGVMAGGGPSGVSIQMRCLPEGVCKQIQQAIKSDDLGREVKVVESADDSDAILEVTAAQGGRLRATYFERSGGSKRLEGSIRAIVADASANFGSPLPQNSAGFIVTDRRDKAAPRRPIDRTFQTSFTVLLYLFITTYGMLISGSVVEEKATRTVDLLLSSTSSTSLLWGKILGIGALGIVQMSIVLASVSWALTAAMAFGAMPGFSRASLVDASVVPGAGTLILSFGFFLLGYFTFASLFALLGSAVADGERSRQYAAVVFIPLYVAFYLSVTSGTANGPLIRILSFVPLFSPMMMFARLSQGTASGFDLASAAAVSTAFASVVLICASRLYSSQRLLRKKNPTASAVGLVPDHWVSKGLG